MRLRVWSETLPLSVLTQPSTLDLLARYGLDLLAAVRPWELAASQELLHACEASGVRVGLWPMLDDRDGRWLNVTNVDAMSGFVDALLAVGAHRPHEIALDLEPPFGTVAALTASLRRAERPPVTLPWSLHPSHGREALRRLTGRIRAAGVGVSAAAVPLVLFDPKRGGTWSWLLGTPVDAGDFDRVSVMLYTSMFEGWSWGLVDRAGAQSLLRLGAELALDRYGAKASVSLGAIATGALGDEPVYRTPHELSDDLAVVRAAGIEDVTLFDLGGAVERGPPERWLSALHDAGSRSLKPHRVHRVGAHLGRVMGGAIPLFSRWFQQSSG